MFWAMAAKAPRSIISNIEKLVGTRAFQALMPQQTGKAINAVTLTALMAFFLPV